MAESAPRPKLGDILTRLRLVDEGQVRAALVHQSRSGKLFGESLLDLGFVGQDDLSWALSSQLGLPYVAVTADMADPELLGGFPADFLRQNLVLPLVASGSSLSVVLADPTDRTTLARLERISGRELSIAVGTPSAIRAALESVLGEDRVEQEPEAGITRLPGHTPPASLSSPELATLVDRALTQGSSIVHLDPDGDGVRVRFRDGLGALVDGGSFSSAALRDLIRSLTDWLGEGVPEAPGIAVWGKAPEQAKHLPFRAVALSSSKGTSLTLVLDGTASVHSRIAAGYEEEWARLAELLERPTGVLLGVAPTVPGGELLLSRLLARFDLGNRRACGAVSGDFNLPKGVMRFGEEPSAEAARGLSRLEGIDVLIGAFDDAQVLQDLLVAASRDRLVVATLPGNGALGFLARVIEAGGSATLLSESLLAVTAQQTLPAGDDLPPRAVTETLFVDRPLRRALQNGGAVEALRKAALEQGFLEIAARIRGIEQVDSAISADLERHRYLEDAA
jgi:hypothetical protein